MARLVYLSGLSSGYSHQLITYPLARASMYVMCGVDLHRLEYIYIWQDDNYDDFESLFE